MIDYSNVVEPMRCEARGGRRLGRFLLALVVLGTCLGYHLAGGSDGRPAEVKKVAPALPTVAQINTMRANGRLLSLRGLTP